jgi:hypothetical protein
MVSRDDAADDTDGDVDATSCLQTMVETVEIYYCGGFVPLVVTMCHGLSSCVLP